MALSSSYTLLSLLFIVISQILLTAFIINAPIEDDKIERLPGQPQVNFQQYSGYIYVDDHQQRALFYYFVEAETDPASKPLVLWLSGGPGISSIGMGAFIEQGPFKPSGNRLIKNDFSWNKEANMLYLESPAGVGFSFSKNKSFYAYIDDDMTARDNIVFLERFLKKYQAFRNNDLYLAGDSYAGHYLPQLAHRIINSKVKINLKGVALGNPLLDFNTYWNSRAEYLWSHGVISDATYHLLNTVCNFSQIRRQAARGYFSPSCEYVRMRASREFGHYLDFYDVTLDRCLPPFLNHTQDSPRIDICVTAETIVYLNREDVRKAIQARLVNVEEWSLISGSFHYNMEDNELPMLGMLHSLVKLGVRVLAYCGDQDSVFPLTGTRILIDRLANELELNTTVAYRAWFEGEQIGGWTQVYGDNLISFATIRGGSHLAPFSQPNRSLVLFRSFILGQPLPTIDIWK